MLLRFQLTMPNVGSWNGKDTGTGDDCFAWRNVPKEKAETIKDKSFYYDFGDGWGANIRITQNRRCKTAGFRGYNWMINSIIENGKIIAPSYERCKQAEIDTIKNSLSSRR